jgi:hypothetical protein
MTVNVQLEADGYALLAGAFSAETVTEVLSEWREVTQRYEADAAILASGGGPAYGARNLLDLWPRVVELVRVPPIRSVLLETLGSGAGLVRGLFFAKPPGHSWALPWHKDYTLAVRSHSQSATFAKPTIKAGVPHVAAPQGVLDRMLTVRIHLDDMSADNGPLRLIPGSHRMFHQNIDPEHEAVTLHCRAGDVLFMRPLLTHASGHSRTESQQHRRVIHLECAADRNLPDDYCWKWFEPIGATPGD